jgi:hypothetical protein
MTIEQAREHIGHGVVYRSYPGANGEDGTITSVNDSYVFVLYAGGTTPKATRPADLELLAASTAGEERL